MSTPERLVWIDCEMTGLSTSSDALIEVACIVTDADLNVVGDGVQVVIRPPDGAVEGMSDFVRDMHASSGLTPLLADGVTLAEAEAKLLEYVRQHVPEGKVPLAGNTVSMDRLFLERDMPTLAAWLHYRTVDVSSIKELVRRWYPRVYFAAPAKTGAHRAMGDIEDSIRELRYYREAVFVSLPGPDSETAKQVAALVTASAPTHNPEEAAAAHSDLERTSGAVD